MKYLAIDTSGKNLTLVLNIDGEIYSYFDSECGVNHSTQLMPKLEQILNGAKCNLSELDFIACVVGAGSFTGIRIGVATVKALCFAYSLPCLSITSFDTLAYNKKSGKVLAVIDAKHDGFYVCGYDNGNVDMQPKYVMRDELEQIKGEYTLVASEHIDGLNVEVVKVLDGLVSAVNVKEKLATLDLESLTPLYVRKSQAEEGR